MIPLTSTVLLMQRDQPMKWSQGVVSTSTKHHSTKTANKKMKEFTVKECPAYTAGKTSITDPHNMYEPVSY